MRSTQDMPYGATEEEPDAAAHALQGIVRFLRLLERRKFLVGAFVLGGFALGLGYFLLAPRKYQSTAKLMISIQQAADQVSNLSEQSNWDTIMASQRELVRSSKVVRAAIEQLPPEHRVDLVDCAPHEWVQAISDSLQASNVRKTNHMEVRYQSLHPDAASAVVDAVINSYLDFVEKTHRGAAASVLDSQRQRLALIETKLDEKQRRLHNLRGSVEALTATGEEGIVDPVVSEAIHLHKALLEARQERIELQSSLATVDQALRTGADVRRHMGLVQEAVGEQVLLTSLGLSPQDAEIQVEQQKVLLGAQEELARVSPFLGPRHPRVAALNQQIQATQQYLVSYRSAFGDRLQGMSNEEIGPLLKDVLQQAVTRASAYEQQINTSYAVVFQQATSKSSDIDEMERLQREVEQLELDRHAYDQKIADVDVHQLLAPIRATIVQDPLPNEKPVSPRLRVAIVGATMLGLLLGALVVYAQDLLDDRFSSPDEMVAQLGVPVLSLIRTLKPTGGTGLDAVQMHAGDDDVEAEAFRTLRTALTLQGEVADRLVVSSAEPSDGKTTVSANLAVSFAQVGKRTLVIDADLRRPGMTALLDLKGKPGLTDLLIGEGDTAELAEQIVRPSGLEGLDVIPAGPRRPNPAELLSSKNFADVLAWADSRYDQVLVDCPPVLAVSDAQIVGRLVDGVVMVITPEKNHRRLVARAVDSFVSAGVHLFGVVGNRISEQTGGGYGYGYGYGYSYGSEEDDPPAVDDQAADILPGRWNRSQQQTASAPSEDQRAA